MAVLIPHAVRRASESVIEQPIAQLVKDGVSYRTILINSDTEMNHLMNHFGRRCKANFNACDYTYFWFRAKEGIVLAFAAPKPVAKFFDAYMILAAGKVQYTSGYKVLQAQASPIDFEKRVRKLWATRAAVRRMVRAYGGSRLNK